MIREGFGNRSMSLAAAWPYARLQFPDPPFQGTEVDLDGLWQKTRVDFQGWAELAQVDALQVINGWQVLKPRCSGGLGKARLPKPLDEAGEDRLGLGPHKVSFSTSSLLSQRSTSR